MRLALQENLSPGESLSEKLANMEEIGFEGLEVWGTSLPERVSELKSALSISKIKLSTICVGYGGDLLGADRKVRETAIEGLKERLEICSKLGGVGVIVVPTGREFKIMDLYPWKADVREIERRILIEELKIVGKYADDFGSSVLLEPLNRYETHFLNRLEQGVDICKSVGCEQVKIMADFFHMSIEEVLIEDSLDRAADYISHIHLADSNRLLPGCGHTNFRSAFQILKKNGYSNYMAIECKIIGDKKVELQKAVRHIKGII